MAFLLEYVRTEGGTVTTYEVEERSNFAALKAIEIDTPWRGVVYRQKMTGGYGLPNTHHTPSINKNAPPEVLLMAKAMAAKNWRCDPSLIENDD